MRGKKINIEVFKKVVNEANTKAIKQGAKRTSK
jgi:hypothetical protein